MLENGTFLMSGVHNTSNNFMLQKWQAYMTVLCGIYFGPLYIEISSAKYGTKLFTNMLCSTVL